MSKTPIGNVKGFTTEMVKNMMYVIGVGYMGGSIASMCKAGNELFPYDISKPPYAGPLSKGDEEDLLEYLWPMKSVGFPYSTMIHSGPSPSSQYLKWLLETCAYSFSAIRFFYAESAKIGDTVGKKNVFGDLFRFYAIPYMLILIMPGIPIGVFFMTVFASLYRAGDGYGYMYALAPLTGWAYGFSLCNKTITFGCLVTMCVIGMAGFMLPIINIPWLFVVTFAVTMYSYVILLLSPFLWTGGLYKTFQEMKRHKLSLVLLFMFFTLRTANQYLTQQVSSGLFVGALYVLYTLITSRT
jgi:hypothetical protein